MYLHFHTGGSSNYLLCVVYFFWAAPYCHASTLKCFIGSLSTTGKTSVVSNTCRTAATVRPITACLIFKYQIEADGSQNDTRLTYGGIGGDQFSCDSEHRCEWSVEANKSWMYNVTVDGRRGALYCCQTSKCNDPRIIHKAQTAVPCFVGSTSGNKTEGSWQPCALEKCFNKTYGNTTEHRCDTEGICIRNGLVNDQCTQISESGVAKRLCCCSKARCNLDADRQVILQRNVAPTAKTQENDAGPRPMVPMAPDVLPPGARAERKSRVAGIVSAAVLGTALVVLVVVIGVKQWQRYREKYNFSYMQLTADMMVL